MKTILLACAAGMSTSLLVTKMKKAAEDKGLNLHIYAVSAPEVEGEITANKIDCVLLGPQIKYEEPKMKALLEPHGIPLAVIKMTDYGMMNGANVLESALALLGE